MYLYMCVIDASLPVYFLHLPAFFLFHLLISIQSVISCIKIDLISACIFQCILLFVCVVHLPNYYLICTSARTVYILP
uniref:Uncharacterized protein n=1 Tax=Octopus bimaculoides TaxID=37653 RepID=A0A0L8GT24_OCTBM